jgi:hypothetical protein
MSSTFFRTMRLVYWWVIPIVIVAYTVVAWHFDNTDILVIMRSLQLTVSGALIWLLWNAFRIVWRDRDHVDEEHVALTGQLLLWIAMFLVSIWLLLWRVSDEPRWMVDSAVNGFLVILVIFAGMFQLAAPGAREGRFPRRALKALTVAVVLALVVASLGFYFTNEVTEFTEMIRPWLGETHPEPPGPTGYLDEWKKVRRP